MEHMLSRIKGLLNEKNAISERFCVARDGENIYKFLVVNGHNMSDLQIKVKKM